MLGENVPVKVTLVSGLEGTQVAGVRFLPGVDSEVPVQMPAAVEIFVAQRTRGDDRR